MPTERPAVRRSCPGSDVRIQLLDVLTIIATVIVALAAGWGWGGPLAEDRTRQFLALGLVVVWPIALWQAQSTVTTILGRGLEEYRRVMVASWWTGVTVAAAAYLVNSMRGRWFLLGALVFGTGMLLLERVAMRIYLHRLMAAGQALHRVFVVAAPAREPEIRATLEDADGRFLVVGSWHLTGEDPDPTEIVGQATAARADTLVVAPLGTEGTHWTRRLGWAMEESDLSMLVSPSLVEIAGPRL